MQSLLESAIADDDTRGGAFDLAPKIRRGGDQLRMDLPVFPQQYFRQLHRGPALIVQQHSFGLVYRRLAEDTYGGYIPITPDAIVAIDMIFAQGGDHRHRYEPHIDLVTHQ